MLFIDMSRDMTEPTALCQSRRLATLDVVTSALDNFVANNMVKRVDTMMKYRSSLSAFNDIRC
jgi:hypothetical protein